MLSGQAAASCQASMEDVRDDRGGPDEEEDDDDDDDDEEEDDDDEEEDDDDGGGKDGNGNDDDDNDGGDGGMGLSSSLNPPPPPECIMDLPKSSFDVPPTSNSGLRGKVKAPIDGNVRCKGIQTVTTSVPSMIMYPFGPSSQCHRVVCKGGRGAVGECVRGSSDTV